METSAPTTPSPTCDIYPPAYFIYAQAALHNKMRNQSSLATRSYDKPLMTTMILSYWDLPVQMLKEEIPVGNYAAI